MPSQGFNFKQYKSTKDVQIFKNVTIMILYKNALIIYT